MSIQGGIGRDNQIKIWQNASWTINLYSSEIVPMTRKRKAENVFIQQGKKIAQALE